MALARVRRALTLLEIVVVIGVLMVLASILYPIIAKARLAALQGATKSNLHQIYIGLEMYRENNNSKVDFGPTIDMGLPIGMASSDAYLEVVGNKQIWRSPCCCHPDGPTGSPSYTTHHMDYADFFTDSEVWDHYVRQYQGDAVAVVDMHCAAHDIPLYAPTEPIRLVGVRLNGRVESRAKTISAADFAPFWNWN